MSNQVYRTDWTLRLSMILLTVTALLAYLNTDGLIKQNAVINHSYEFLSTLELVKSMVADAERGQRGYLLTGKELYLEPYDNAILRLDPAIDYLASLKVGNHDQQENIYLLRAEINKKISELKKTVNLSKNEKLDEAMTIISTDVGRKYMENIQNLILKIKNTERDSLYHHIRVSSNLGYRSLFIFPVLVILEVLLVNYSLGLIRGERVVFEKRKDCD